MNISVCLIVKDEELNIERVLKSIPSSFEVIIYDTGSKDRTVEIAEKYNAVIKQGKWNDDFAQARNQSVSWATGEYILILDADEELPPYAEAKLNQFITEHPGRAGTVFLENIMENDSARHRMVRFFPNKSAFQFKGIVHEQLYENEQPANFKDTGLVIKHYGYTKKEYSEKDKFNRYLKLYQKALAERHDEGYMLYQIGKLYNSVNQFKEAEHYLRRSLEYKEENKLYYPPMLVLLGYTLKELGRSKEAVDLLTRYGDVYKDFPDLFFLLGLLAMDTGEIHIIEPSFKEALRIGETNKYTSVLGTGSFKAAYNLGVYYEILGFKDKAKEYYKLAASWGYDPALIRLKNI
ncbi:tetratricopeptide repeat-containing glycosyltransferase family 2 protein [Paenibacillus oleatilyticus]|uniref:Glycosyltransferase n=1 Tax=Paenibacillus oleatilyticus TaxID=2594886 RepID=A0ABV4V9S4_9BACL